MTIKNKSKAIKIAVFFAILLSFFIGFYAFLHRGVAISELSLGAVKVERFYLKISKKLIFSADLVQIDKNEDSNDINDSLRSGIKEFLRIRSFLSFFQEFKIKSLKLGDYELSLDFDGENFLANSSNFYAKAKIINNFNTARIDISKLAFKPQNIIIFGGIDYDKNNHKLNGDLNTIFLKENLENLDSIESFGEIFNEIKNNSFMNLKASIESDFEKIFIKGFSEEFKSIAFLKNIIPSTGEEIADGWIYDNHECERMKLANFSTEINIKDPLASALENLKAQVIMQNAKVHFAEKIKPIELRELEVLFENDSLIFNLKEPKYANLDLEGSVILGNLLPKFIWEERKQSATSKIKAAVVNTIESTLNRDRNLNNDFMNKKLNRNNRFLDIKIKSNAPLNEDILDILKHYDIPLPLSSKDKIDVELRLDIDLEEFIVRPNGKFSAKNTAVFLSGAELISDDLLVYLNEELQVHIFSKNTKFKDMLNADAKLALEADKKELNGELLVHRAVLSEKNPHLFLMQDNILPINADFNEDITIELPTLNLKIIAGDKILFENTDISTGIVFSDLLKSWQINSGNFTMETADFNQFSAQGKLNSEQKLLLDKTSFEPVSELEMDFEMDIDNDKLQLKTKDSRVVLNQNKSGLHLVVDGYAINADKSAIPQSDNEQEIKLLIEGINTDFRFLNRRILADSFSAFVNNDDFKINFNYKKGRASIEKTNGIYNIKLDKFNDIFVNTIAQKDLARGGNFSIIANSKKDDVLMGEIKFSNTSLNELHTLQNVMAFIDTLPSLVSLRGPGFNDDGYFVENGVIKFGVNDKYLAMPEVLLNGSSIDIQGKGILVLDTQEISFNARLITAKNISKIISFIPLVNYILLGKDKQIYTNFNISGTLSDMKVQTQVAQDILLSPLNVLSRTLLSPIEIFSAKEVKQEKDFKDIDEMISHINDDKDSIKQEQNSNEISDKKEIESENKNKE